jgi:nucleoid-associated protein YgaU
MSVWTFVKEAGERIVDNAKAAARFGSPTKTPSAAPAPGPSTVRVSGTAKDQPTKEKVILCCGNIAGVEKVVDDLAVEEAAPQAQFHTVMKGDTLSAIAKKYYDDASRYPEIFEANKPMLKHPDKIYPGQSLRIPI